MIPNGIGTTVWMKNIGWLQSNRTESVYAATDKETGVRPIRDDMQKIYNPQMIYRLWAVLSELQEN